LDWYGRRLLAPLCDVPPAGGLSREERNWIEGIAGIPRGKAHAHAFVLGRHPVDVRDHCRFSGFTTQSPAGQEAQRGDPVSAR
jgi:hypothetical protein